MAATATSKHISPYFYCHCPHNTNHTNIAVKTSGKATRADLNTFWHVIEEGGKGLLKIASITEIREFATSIFNKDQPIITGYEIEIANSSGYTPDQIESLVYRKTTQDVKVPFYQKSDIYLKEKSPTENYKVRMMFIDDISEIFLRKATFQTNKLFEEGKDQEAKACQAAYFQTLKSKSLQLHFRD